MRRIICLLLLVCLPLQGFALPWSMSTPAAGVLHEIDHDEGRLHHHDDGGSVHYDDSEESAEHLQDHSSPQPVALIAPQLPGVPPEPAMAAVGGDSSFLPDPLPDRLQRPPAPSLG